jgi:transcriptional regulator with XRE-family HTH domain
MADRGVGVDTIEDPLDAQFSAERYAKAEADLPAAVGQNLRRLRARSGLSLEKLSSLSGVSRGMIGRIETGKSVPTVGLLSRLADALNVELASLLAIRQAPMSRVLRLARSTTLQLSDGKFRTRPLSGSNAPGTEFYEIAISPSHFEEGARRAPGARAHVVVAAGIVVVTIAGETPATLAARDAIIFPADAVHGFHNVGDDDAILYVTLSGTGRD